MKKTFLTLLFIGFAFVLFFSISSINVEAATSNSTSEMPKIFVICSIIYWSLFILGWLIVRHSISKIKKIKKFTFFNNIKIYNTRFAVAVLLLVMTFIMMVVPGVILKHGILDFIGIYIFHIFVANLLLFIFTATTGHRFRKLIGRRVYQIHSLTEGMTFSEIEDFLDMSIYGDGVAVKMPYRVNGSETVYYHFHYNDRGGYEGYSYSYQRVWFVSR